MNDNTSNNKGVSLPRTVIHLDKLNHNLNEILKITKPLGITVAFVTKVVCADPEIVKVIEKSQGEFFADSRLDNLASIKSDKPRMLIRLASPGDAEKVILNTEMSLESEIATIELLAKYASLHKKKHKVILMVDMGDLREGIFFKNRELIIKTAQTVVDSPYLELYGVGVNLTCYGAIIPDKENLGGLVEMAKMLRAHFNLPIPLVSGGNSSSIGIIRDGQAPGGITNLRIGEAFVLGNDTALCEVMPNFHDDAIVLQAELIEVQTKPSKPIGTSGANAFGESVQYEDIGERRRGILAIGRQDTVAEGLTALDNTVKIIGASSDHLLVDITDSKPYKVGDVLEFKLDYGALLRAFTSKYVSREYVGSY